MAEAKRELPRIKVCGLTNPADVRLAVEAGADACGFVHYPPSPRSVPVDELVSVTAAVPPGVQRVLVVVDTGPSELEALARAGDFHWVQLCGSEKPESWVEFPLPILRRLPAEERGLEELQAWKSLAAGFVIDHPANPGGSGLAVDLSWAERLCSLAPSLLAGGLDGDNVAQRVESARPWGVDAASRLEADPGRKDPEAIRKYVHAAKRALSLLSPDS